MLINQQTSLVTPRVTLVPYCRHHVPKYHEWMQDEQLQELTASEPLTLEEEYSMQESWRQDHDKLTFIVCTNGHSLADGHDDSLKAVGSQATDDEVKHMIGDVNVFLNVEDADVEDNALTSQQMIVGEIELMIAEADYRGKGLGAAILNTFLWYIVSNLQAIKTEFNGCAKTEATLEFEYFRAKINATNIQSIRLFERAGFVKMLSTPNVFGEVELRCPLDEVRSLVEQQNSRNIVLSRYDVSGHQ